MNGIEVEVVDEENNYYNRCCPSFDPVCWRGCVGVSYVRYLDTSLGGGLVIALILAALWALVFYNRLSSGPDLIPPGWEQRSAPPLPDHQSGWREVQPPQITTNQNAGEWHSQGPAVYDLWKEDPPGQIVDGQWQ